MVPARRGKSKGSRTGLAAEHTGVGSRAGMRVFAVRPAAAAAFRLHDGHALRPCAAIAARSAENHSSSTAYDPSEYFSAPSPGTPSGSLRFSRDTEKECHRTAHRACSSFSRGSRLHVE